MPCALKDIQRRISYLLWVVGGDGAQNREVQVSLFPSLQFRAFSSLAHPHWTICTGVILETKTSHGRLEVMERGNMRTREGHGHICSSLDLPGLREEAYYGLFSCPCRELTMDWGLLARCHSRTFFSQSSCPKR